MQQIQGLGGDNPVAGPGVWVGRTKFRILHLGGVILQSIQGQVAEDPGVDPDCGCCGPCTASAWGAGRRIVS